LPDVEEISSDSYDVIVIGAGIAGLAATATAAARAARVLTLEAEPALARGASGRNAGILSSGLNIHLSDLPADSPHRAMWGKTNAEAQALVEQTKQPGSLLNATLTGSLCLAESATAARRVERDLRDRLALGLRAEIWSANEVAQHTGGRLETATVVNALWLPDEGRIQPWTLLAQMAEKARAAGAELAGNARVARWEARGKGATARWTITLESGRTFTGRGLIVATGPLVTPTARIYALAWAIDLPVDFPLFWDAAPYIYADYRPGPGYVVSSGWRYGRAGGSPHEDAYYRGLARQGYHWLPELAEAAPSHAWAVDLEVNADSIPMARELGAAAPGLAIEGLGALGVLPGAVLGREAGERIVKTSL
jgi:glycine/D-amino acid oxidase-like deaminating enzyme